MARILFINTVCNGSTGKICNDIYDIATQNGHTCCLAYGRGTNNSPRNSIKIGNRFAVYYHVLKTRLTDKHGFESKLSTKLFLKEVDIFKPDIIHLHNIHGYYINVEMLFNYFKKHPNIKIIWTLHDCWSFTGHCSYFLYNRCNKWKTGCYHCDFRNMYPKSFSDRSQENYMHKSMIFNGVQDMTITTVSKWLESLVKSSYLNQYPILTIKNGLNLETVKWNDEIIRKYEYLIQMNKKIILGVSNVWNEKKGLSDFNKMANLLPDEYRIVLVGLHKKQMKELPHNIIGIERTDNQNELYYLYSIATVFFNPTKEETFGMTNIEAQVVGTPVVTYDSGGTAETIVNDNCFLIHNNVEEFLYLLKERNFENMKNKNVDTSLFDKNNFYKDYIFLYEKEYGEK